MPPSDLIKSIAHRRGQARPRVAWPVLERPPRMRRRRSRRRKHGSGVLKGLLLLIIFACASVILVSCARHISRPSRTSYHASTPVQPRQSEERRPAHSHPSPEPTASREPEEPESAQPEQAGPSKADAPTTSASDKPADQEPTVVHQSGDAASPGPERVFRTKEFARGLSADHRIAITFDAGADSSPTPGILDALAKHGVHATFFLTGKWIEKNPDMVRRIVSEGHEIGNHTYSHKRLTGLSAGEITTEVEKTEQLVADLTGHSTKPLLRVPYGSRDSRVLQVLNGLGYRSIYWDVDSWDSVKAGITSDQIEERVLRKIRNGSVVLMHCGSKATADALDTLLRKLSDEGYRQVTISELAGE